MAVTMDINHLLDRLGGVRKTGTGRYLAKCPSHDDRSPSLSLRELEDGRVLLHCFGGCAVTDVVAAIGLELSDLFPEKPDKHINGTNREVSPFYGVDILRALISEIYVVAAAAESIALGDHLTADDHLRLLSAISRIDAAANFAKSHTNG